MIQRVGLSGMVLLLIVVLAGCGAPAAPVATPAASAAATAVAPSTASTPLPLPAQPTAPAQPSRAPSPFQSATPARSFGSAGTTVATSAATVAGTAVPPTSAAAQPTVAGPVPTAPGVATGRRSEVKFAFVTPLKPAEEAEPPELVAIRTALMKVPGFIDISGDEKGATVGYDAGLITVEQLMQRLSDLQHPVTRQG